MRMRWWRSVMGSLVLGALTVGTLAGCGPKAGAVKAHGPALYDKLGGREAIAAVVADFVDSVKADDRIKAKFAGISDWEAMNTKLTEQLCVIAGGPCTDQSKDLKAAHAGIAISESDFTVLTEDLKKTLDKFRVGEKEQTELLGVLAATKKDLVSAPNP